MNMRNDWGRRQSGIIVNYEKECRRGDIDRMESRKKLECVTAVST